MIKTKTFVVRGRTTYIGDYNGTDVAAKKLDDMIKKFIEEKTAEYTSFKVINIQYRPIIESERYWYPSAMLVYDE